MKNITVLLLAAVALIYTPALSVAAIPHPALCSA
jgi:hypothetical protein